MKYVRKNSTDNHKKGEAPSGETRKHLVGKQRFEIYETLKKYVIPTAYEGLCEYTDGMTDEKVAEMHKCSVNSVQTIRKECFGMLRSKDKSYGGGGAAYSGRLRGVMDRLDAIEEYLTRVDPKWSGEP